MKVCSDLKQLSPKGDNLKIKDIALVSLYDELSDRFNFEGKPNFDGVTFDMLSLSNVGQSVEVQEYFTVDEKDREIQIRSEVYNPSKKMKLLKAVTGFGKTTEFPLSMFRAREDSLIIVIEPSDMLARDIYTYQRSRHVPVHYIGVEGTGSLPQNGVLYCSARTFLCMLKRNDLDIPNFLILQIDESHVETPEYDTLYMLIHHDAISVDKIILTSATHKGNMIYEKRLAYSIRDVEIPFEGYVEFSEEFIIDSIEDGFLSADTIYGATMIFMPYASLCEIAKNKYRELGIQCRCLTEYSTYKDLIAARKFLQSSTGNSRSILLVTSVVETGITLPVQTVIDLSLKEDIYFDIDNNKLVRGVRGVSDSEAMQRRGRCGRITSGTYRYVKCWRDPAFVTKRPDIYTALWYAIFGYRLPPKKSNLKVLEILGVMSSAKAAVILKSGIHPLYMLPYFHKSGFLYSNSYGMVKKLFKIDGLKKCDMFLNVEDANWINVKVGLPTGVSNVFIPYACDSFDSILLVYMSNEMLKNETFNDTDEMTNETFVYPVNTNQFYGEPDEFTSSIDMINSHENKSMKLKDMRKKPTYGSDSAIGSYRSGLDEHMRYTLPLAAASVIGSEEGNSTIANKLDEMQNVLENFMMNNSRHVPPKSPIPFDEKRKKRRVSLIEAARSQGKLLNIDRLRSDQLIMPLGCKSITLLVDPDCEDFIKCLLKGDFDARTLSIDELKTYCIYLCQYFNHNWTNQNIKKVSKEYARKRANFFTKHFGVYPRLKNEHKALVDVSKALKKIIPEWQRLGLYLTHFKFGVNEWYSDCENLFVNDCVDEF